MKSDTRQKRKSQPFKSGFLRCCQAPAIEQIMHARRDQQRRCKAMQALGAAGMVVRVLASRADRMHITIHQPKQAESGYQTCAALLPAVRLPDLGENPEQRNPHQQASAERKRALSKR